MYGFTVGAITGGLLAYQSGNNVWWGNAIKYGRNKWSFINLEKPYKVIDFGIENVEPFGRNSCVVDSEVEIANHFGDEVDAERIANRVHFVNGEGSRISFSDYEISIQELGYKTEQVLKASSITLDKASEIASDGGIISTFSFGLATQEGNMNHADVIRSISFYSNKAMFKLRIKSYKTKYLDTLPTYLLYIFK